MRNEINRNQIVFRRRASAFTLIELLLVLVILAVLAAIVVPKFASRSEQAKMTAAKTDISVFEDALDQFEIDNGRYPTSEEGLGILTTGLAATPRLYVKRIPNDPWGTPYVYKFPGTVHPNGFDVLSLGPDTHEGNDDLSN